MREHERHRDYPWIDRMSEPVGFSRKLQYAPARCAFWFLDVLPTLQENSGRSVPSQLEEILQNKTDYFDIHRISERGYRCRPSRKMSQTVHGLQSSAFANSNVAPLPADDGYLCCGHRHQRGGGGRSLNSNSGCSELNYVSPDVADLTLAIPFKFLQAGRKLANGREPFVNPTSMLSVDLPILHNE